MEKKYYTPSKSPSIKVKSNSPKGMEQKRKRKRGSGSDSEEKDDGHISVGSSLSDIDFYADDRPKKKFKGTNRKE